MKRVSRNATKTFFHLILLSVATFTLAKFCFAQDLERFGDEKSDKQTKPQQVPANPIPEKAQNPAPIFSSDDPSSHLSAPDERAPMRINPEAPGPFIGLAEAYFRGDDKVAKLYARQFVTYMSDLMFAVKDITRLIGEAMIEKGQIEDDEWVGVEQYLDYELTKARTDSGAALKITNEDALKRITPDPKGEIEVYYFFTLNSSFARKMSPDVERLWQIAKKDPRIKMVGLTLGAQPKEFVDSYRKYTGLTLPIFNGELVAKKLSVAFVPAIVVVSPNAKTAYLKTGQESFERLYQLVRTAQGENPALSREANALIQLRIGRAEKDAAHGKNVITTPDGSNGLSESGLSRITYPERDIDGEQGLSRF